MLLCCLCTLQANQEESKHLKVIKSNILPSAMFSSISWSNFPDQNHLPSLMMASEDCSQNFFTRLGAVYSKSIRYGSLVFSRVTVRHVLFRGFTVSKQYYKDGSSKTYACKIKYTLKMRRSVNLLSNVYGSALTVSIWRTAYV